MERVIFSPPPSDLGGPRSIMTFTPPFDFMDREMLRMDQQMLRMDDDMRQMQSRVSCGRRAGGGRPAY